MLNQALSASLERSIATATGDSFRIERNCSVGGGCINAACRIEGSGRAFFVKINRQELAPMFEAEAEGLREIAASETVRVPRPVCCGASGDQAFLVLEYVELHPGRAASDRLLGRQLAAMHRIRQPFFGWHRDNTIGSTPQINDRGDDWIRFWATRRLGFQLALAAENGHSRRLKDRGKQLVEKLAGLFDGYLPQPSLLHGDLWGGNHAQDEGGRPVIFDPACYYGDREADLAMTELFGGFGGDFYAAYAEALPLDPGYPVRKTLYNLYHILNHLNLFGGGYASQAEAMVGRLLAELG